MIITKLTNQSTETKNILVATDFSPASNSALLEAAAIAKSGRGQITAVNVISNPRSTLHSASIDAKLDLLYGERSEFWREVLAESESRLLEQIASVANGEHPIRHKKLLGTPYVEICRMVQHGDFDLVVLGKHSQSAWKSMFVGSTAKQVVRLCPSPVLVVGKEHVQCPKRLLVAVDFSDASRQAVALAMSVAEKLGATVDLLYVLDSREVPSYFLKPNSPGFSIRKEMTEEAKRKLDEFVQTLSARVHKAQIVWGIPWQEICSAAEKLKTDWIVTGTFGRTGIGAWFLGSTAEQVLNHSECSLLTVKAPGFCCPVPPAELATSITDRATLIG